MRQLNNVVTGKCKGTGADGGITTGYGVYDFGEEGGDETSGAVEA